MKIKLASKATRGNQITRQELDKIKDDIQTAKIPEIEEHSNMLEQLIFKSLKVEEKS